MATQFLLAQSTCSLESQAGWPVMVDGGVRSAPTLADLDGDGTCEVVFGTWGNEVYVLRYDGSNFEGWPNKTRYIVSSSPAVGDIDGDGDLEIVVSCTDRKVYSWHHDGTMVKGWPVLTGNGIRSSPALGDLNGDGFLDVVVNSDKLYAWNHDGSLLKGWPVPLMEYPSKLGGYVDSSPALADIDRDGDLEIVIGSRDGTVWVLHGDGSHVARWSVSAEAPTISSPALGDMNGDGNMEIIIGCFDGRVWICDYQGTVVDGWPVGTNASIISSPALGDMDGDTDLETVIGSGCLKNERGGVYAWHQDGQPLVGWPTFPGTYIIGIESAPTQVESSPVLGDIDGDGDIEVIVGAEDQNAYAWHHSGTLVAGWPQWLDDSARDAAALGDLDGDGDIEVVLGQLGERIFAWDCRGVYDPRNLPWPMFHHDAHHTGCFGSDPYEPDNAPQQATMVQTLGRVQDHTLYHKDDRDWFKFPGARGDVLTFELKWLGRDCDPCIEIIGADGITRLHSYAGAPSDSFQIDKDEVGLTIQWEVPASGIYYVSVSNANAEASGQQTQYSILIRGSYPQAPTGLSAEPGDGVVHLTWTRNLDPDVSGYRIYYTERSRSGDSIQRDSLGARKTDHHQFERRVDVGNITRYRIDGLNNGNVYRFRLTAYDSRGRESGYSREMTVSPQDLPPSAPANVTILNPGNGSLLLKWAPNPERDVATYRVHWGTSSGPYEYSADVGTDTSYQLHGLAPTLHYFTLTAHDGSGQGSGYSTEVSGLPQVLFPETITPWILIPEPGWEFSWLKESAILLMVMTIVALIVTLPAFRRLSGGTLRRRLKAIVILVFGISTFSLISRLFSFPLVLSTLSLSLTMVFLALLLRLLVPILLEKARPYHRRLLGICAALTLLLFALLIFELGLRKGIHETMQSLWLKVQTVLADGATQTFIEVQRIGTQTDFREAVRREDYLTAKQIVEKHMFDTAMDPHLYGIALLANNGRSQFGVGVKIDPPATTDSIPRIILTRQDTRPGFQAALPVPTRESPSGWLLLWKGLGEDLVWKAAGETGFDIQLTAADRILASTVGLYPEPVGLIPSALTGIGKIAKILLLPGGLGNPWISRLRLHSEGDIAQGELSLIQHLHGSPFNVLPTAKVLLILSIAILLTFSLRGLPSSAQLSQAFLKFNLARFALCLLFFGLILAHLLIPQISPASILIHILFISLVYVLLLYFIICLGKVEIDRRLRKKLRMKFSLSYLVVGLLPIIFLFIYFLGFNLRSQLRLIEKELDDHLAYAHSCARALVSHKSWFHTYLRNALDSGDDFEWISARYLMKRQFFWHYTYPEAFITIQVTPENADRVPFKSYDTIAPRAFKTYQPLPGWLAGGDFRGIAYEKGRVFLKTIYSIAMSYQGEWYDIAAEVHIPLDKFLLRRMEKKIAASSPLADMVLEGPVRAPATASGLDVRNPFFFRYDLEVVDWETGNTLPFALIAQVSASPPVFILSLIWALLFFILFPLVLSGVGAFVSHRAIVKPIEKLVTGTQRIGSGELDYKIDIRKRDEFGQLAEAFNRMTEDLRSKVRELTEKERIEELSRMQSEFLSNVTHDLRTPLTTIQGAVLNMLRGISGDLTPKQEKYTNMIKRSGDRLLRLINSLLDLSRMEAGRIELHLQPIDLPETIGRITAAMDIQSEKLSLHLSSSFAEDLPQVQADRDRLEEIITNLLDNAMKFTPREGSITISAQSLKKGLVEVSVSDTGVGIPHDRLHKIFDRFQRYPDPSGREVEGSGLGLYIVKSLVELHGGTIRVESEVGKGSTFVFTLKTV
jgi:signal transduction histidine kinase